MNERRDLMKAIKECLNDLTDYYQSFHNSIESCIKDIKKILNSNKGDPMIDLMYAILKELID